MISTERHEILRELERLSELTPDVRFGQLIANLAFIAAGPWNETLWDLEDEQLLVAMRKHLADLSAGSPQASAVAGDECSIVR